MFKIECHAEDRKVTTIMRTLASIGVFNLEVHPIIDGESKGGSAADVIVSTIKKHGGRASSRMIRDEIKFAGLSVKSTSNSLTNLIKSRTIKRPSRGVYELTKQGRK